MKARRKLFVFDFNPRLAYGFRRDFSLSLAEVFMQTKKVIFLLLIVIGLVRFNFAQTEQDLPVLPKSAKDLAGFVPANWKIADKLEGDLDSDGNPETVLVLQGADKSLIKDSYAFEHNLSIKDEKTGDFKLLIDNNPIILAVVSQQKDGYKLIAVNNQLIPPFTGEMYNWKHSVSLENNMLNVRLIGRVSSGVMDIFGDEVKFFRFQMQNSRLVLVKAQTKGWSNAMLAVGNGRRDIFERYDFTQKKDYLTYTNKTNEEPIKEEEESKITDLIAFDTVSNSFSELKKTVDAKIEKKIETRQKDLIKIQYGQDTRHFYYQVTRNESERKLVEKEISGRSAQASKLAESKGFKCKEHYFRIVNKANGIFIKTNAKPVKKQIPQTAYLYVLCSNGDERDSTNLGGIIIVETGKVKAHYIFSQVSGFSRISVLPDINENGLSEIGLEFTYGISSQNYSKAIGIYEIDDKGNFNNLGQTDIFRRLVKENYQDTSYTIFFKKGKNPVFYREIYDGDNWTKTEELTQFELNKSVSNPSLVSLNSALPAK